jgi:hypothetical protein
MFDEVCQKRVECRALNIPEELGQVSHLVLNKSHFNYFISYYIIYIDLL